MTNEIDKNWKAITSMSIAAVLIVAIVSFNPLPTNVAEAAATPKTVIVDSISTPVVVLPIPNQKTSCDPANVQHWDKILFKTNDIFESDLGHPTFVPGQTLDIKIQDDPTTIVSIADAIANYLTNTLGYRSFDLLPFTPENVQEIVDVEYAIICVDP